MTLIGERCELATTGHLYTALAADQVAKLEQSAGKLPPTGSLSTCSAARRRVRAGLARQLSTQRHFRRVMPPRTQIGDARRRPRREGPRRQRPRAHARHGLRTLDPWLPDLH